MKKLILVVFVLLFCVSCTSFQKKENCEGNKKPVSIIKVYDDKGNLVE